MRDRTPTLAFRDTAALPRPETSFSRRARFRWAGRIGALLLRLWGATWRIEWSIHPEARTLRESGRPFVHALWHEHLLPLTYTHRGRGFCVLVSESADGEYISQVLHHLGYGTVRGSTSRSSVRALLEAARVGREGHGLAITPDGPRGPRRRLQPGLLTIAQRSGLPIVPVVATARRKKRLASWDRFELPWPFTRLKVWEGEPFAVDPAIASKDLMEAMGPRAQQALDRLEEDAARWCGESEPRRPGREA